MTLPLRTLLPLFPIYYPLVFSPISLAISSDFGPFLSTCFPSDLSQSQCFNNHLYWWHLKPTLKFQACISNGKDYPPLVCHWQLTLYTYKTESIIFSSKPVPSPMFSMSVDGTLLVTQSKNLGVLFSISPALLTTCNPLPKPSWSCLLFHVPVITVSVKAFIFLCL